MTNKKTTDSLFQHSREKNEEERKFLEYHYRQNPGPLADYFDQLLIKHPRDWEKGGHLTHNFKKRNTIYFLIGSQAWKNKSLNKLLELARDMLQANNSQIQFHDKYAGDVFHKNVSKMEKIQNQFLDEKIIPYLTELIKKSNSKK